MVDGFTDPAVMRAVRWRTLTGRYYLTFPKNWIDATLDRQRARDLTAADQVTTRRAGTGPLALAPIDPGSISPTGVNRMSDPRRRSTWPTAEECAAARDDQDSIPPPF